MTKVFALILITMAFALGTMSSAIAQTTTTTPPPPAEKKADDKMDKKAGTAEKHMPSKSASGTVKSATADSVVVAGKEKGKDAEWTFAVDSGTKIRKAGKAVTAADLKAGDSVSVKYHEMDGKTMAQSIAVRGGSSSAKKTSAPAEKPAAEKK